MDPTLCDRLCCVLMHLTSLSHIFLFLLVEIRTSITFDFGV